MTVALIMIYDCSSALLNPQDDEFNSQVANLSAWATDSAWTQWPSDTKEAAHAHEVPIITIESSPEPCREEEVFLPSESTSPTSEGSFNSSPGEEIC
jgi:hypothetical protein